jgi:hypothetical protein
VVAWLLRNVPSRVVVYYSMMMDDGCRKSYGKASPPLARQYSSKTTIKGLKTLETHCTLPSTGGRLAIYHMRRV